MDQGTEHPANCRCDNCWWARMSASVDNWRQHTPSNMPEPPTSTSNSLGTEKCKRCNGRGEVFGSQSSHDQTARKGFIQCRACRGKGTVPKRSAEQTPVRPSPSPRRRPRQEPVYARQPRPRPVHTRPLPVNTRSGGFRLPWRTLLFAGILIAGFVTWVLEDEGEGVPQEETAQTAQEFRLDVEAQVIRLTNERRAAANLRRLTHDPAISVIAREHSQNMLRQDRLEHRLDGRDSNDRARLAGYDCRRDLGGGRYSFGLSENISWRKPYSGSAINVASDIIAGWMSSPGHRANILDGGNARIGVGVAIGGQEIYATQNFSSCL